MRIPNFTRKPQPDREHLFDDLPWEAQLRARQHLDRMIRRHPHRGPWLYPILVGQARRLAKLTREERSTWGRQMLAKRGGYAVQRSYRMQGRTGQQHPAHYAATVSASRRKWRKRKEAEEAERKGLGLPPKARHRFLPLP